MDDAQERLDLGDVIGPGGDQDSAIGGVWREHRIGRVGGVLVFPPFGVQLAEQGHHPNHVVGLTHSDGPGFTRGQRGGVLLKLFEDGVDQGELGLATGEDELVAGGVIQDEQIGQSQFRLVAGLVVVELADPG